MHCLLHLLRGQACEATASHDWNSILALAEEHRVLPFLAHKLLEDRTHVPPIAHAHLLRAQREALHYAFLQTSELKELLRAFATANIPVLLLKGPSLAQRIYGSPALRISSDLDLLVGKPDFPAAALLLRSLGFLPGAIPDDYHQKWSRASTIVELHFDVENPIATNFKIENVWQSAYLADFQGQPAWQFAPEDELLYLCLHAVRHRFDRLSLILDIALALRRFDLRNAHEPTGRRNPGDITRFLALGCSMAQRLYPVDPGLPAPSKHTERLADRLWNDLLTKQPTHHDWASIHRFYLETEPNPWRKLLRRIRHLRILLIRLIDDDFRFAARFGLKRRWQVWLLRPARLASKRRA